MIDWIKRAWRKAASFLEAGRPYVSAPPLATLPLERRPEYLAARREATVAQKNLRLYSIAKERDRLKDRIAVLKGQKKKHSHLRKELERLTRLELEIEGSREACMAIGGDV